MQTKKFIRKPFEIEGIQVTAENMDAVAEWCMGEIHKPLAASDLRFIKVRVHHPLTDRQTKAFIGDWVLYAGKGYKVYTDKAFRKSFDEILENKKTVDDPDQLPLEGVTIVQHIHTSTDEAIRQMVEADQK